MECRWCTLIRAGMKGADIPALRHDSSWIPGIPISLYGLVSGSASGLDPPADIKIQGAQVPSVAWKVSAYSLPTSSYVG